MNTASHAMASAQPFSGAAPMSQAASTAATPSPSLSIQSAAAHTAPAMALNSTTPDPIRTQLPEPMHGYLAAAQQAIAALQSIDLPLVGGKPCKPPQKTRGRRGNAGRATPRISPLRTTPIGHSAAPHSRLTNRKARRLVNEVEAHGLAWTYMDNKKALSIYLLRAF